MTNPADQPREYYPSGTVEYVHATVHADVDPTQPIEIAIGDISPTGTWRPAEWDGDAWTTLDLTTDGETKTTWHRRARTSDPVAFTGSLGLVGAYAVGVRVTDTPEIPIMIAGYANVV